MALVKADDGNRDAMLIDKAPTRDEPSWSMRVRRNDRWEHVKVRTGQIRDIDSDRAQAGYSY